MQLQGPAQRVTIYIGESDRYRGRPLYMAILEFLRREGAAGATVTRGLAGFGAHSRIHTATIVDLSSDLPLRIEWIDSPQTVQALLPQIRRMVDDGLIVLDEVQVLQYAAGRRADPLAQPVHEIMRRDVVTVRPEAPLAQVVDLLLRRGIRCLPVVNASNRPVGIITLGDLLRHLGEEAAPLLEEKADASRLALALRRLADSPLTAADIMARDVVTVAADAPARAAVDRMVRHELKRLPVVDAEGRLVGLVSRIDLLRTMAYHLSGPQEEQPAPFVAGTRIEDLMVRDVSTVHPDADLEQVLQALARSPQRRVVVVDTHNRVVGIISDGDILRRSRHAAHPGVGARLRALLGLPTPEPPPLPRGDERARDLMTTPVITVTPDTPLAEALEIMVQRGIKRIPVVDKEGRLLGLLGRHHLLHGLLSVA